MKQLFNYILMIQLVGGQVAFAQDDKKELTSKEKVAQNLALFQSLSQTALTIAGKNQMLGQMSIAQSQDSLFPDCSVMQTTVGTSNACTDIYGGLLTPNDANGVSLYLNTLRAQKQNYQNDVVKGGNVKGYKKGARCLQDNLEKMTVQLNERIKQVDEFTNKMKQTDAEFRAQLEKNELIPLRKLGSLLYGNTKDRNIDFAALMNNRSCPLMMPTSEINSAAGKPGGAGGLVGIKTEFTPAFTNAQEFKKDAGNIKKNIETNIAFVANKVDQGSLESFTGTEVNTFSSADTKAKEVQGVAFSSALTSIQQGYREELRKVQDLVNKSTAANSPADSELKKSLLSGSSTSDVDQVLQNWKSQKDLECLYTRAGGQAGFNKILSTIADIDPRSSNQGRGSDTKQFGKEIINALTVSKNQTLEQRIAQVSSISKQGRRKDFKIRLSGNYANRGSDYQWSVPELMNSFQKDCKTIESSQTNTNGLSLKEAYANLTKAKNAITKIEKNLVKDIKTQLTDKLLNCGTNAQAVSKKNCNETSFDPKQDFCFNQAVACYNTSYDCFKHLDTLIKTKQNEVNVTTERLKAKVDNYQKAQIAIFNQMQTTFKATASQIEARFAAPFTYPTQVDFSQKGKTFSDTLGIDGLEIDVNDPEATVGQMIKNLEELKKKIDEQNKIAIGKVNDHIKDVQDNYNAAIAILDKEIELCSGVMKQNALAAGERGKVMGDACEVLGRANGPLESEDIKKLAILGISSNSKNCDNIKNESDQEKCRKLMKSNNTCLKSKAPVDKSALIEKAISLCNCGVNSESKSKDTTSQTTICDETKIPEDYKLVKSSCFQLYNKDVPEERKTVSAKIVIAKGSEAESTENDCQETIANYCSASMQSSSRNDSNLKDSTNVGGAVGAGLDILKAFGIGK